MRAELLSFSPGTHLFLSAAIAQSADLGRVLSGGIYTWPFFPPPTSFPQQRHTTTTTPSIIQQTKQPTTTKPIGGQSTQPPSRPLAKKTDLRKNRPQQHPRTASSMTNLDDDPDDNPEGNPDDGTPDNNSRRHSRRHLNNTSTTSGRTSSSAVPHTWQSDTHTVPVPGLLPPQPTPAMPASAGNSRVASRGGAERPSSRHKRQPPDCLAHTFPGQAHWNGVGGLACLTLLHVLGCLGQVVRLIYAGVLVIEASGPSRNHPRVCAGC